MGSGGRSLLVCLLAGGSPAARGLAIPAAVAPAATAYMGSLAAHPLTTKVVTACGLAIAGDALAQKRDCLPAYDVPRATSFVLFDAVYKGGFLHGAFPWMIDTFQGAALLAVLPAVSQNVASAIECTAFNQLIVVPFIYYPLFFGITGAVQGLTPERSFERGKEIVVGITLKNWAFWMPVQMVQFLWLPLELQVPYACVMGLVWNVILSALAGDACAMPEQTDAMLNIEDYDGLVVAAGAGGPEAQRVSEETDVMASEMRKDR